MNDSSAWKKACGLAVAMDFGGGLFSVAIPMTAVSLQADAQWVGVIGSAALAGYTVFCFLAQPLTDRWGRRTSMVLGSSFVTLFCVLMTFAVILKSLPLLGIANFFAGVFYAFFWPATQAMSGVGVAPNRLFFALQAYNLSWSSGRMVGTGLGGVLFELHPIAPFVIGTLVSGAVAFSSSVLSLPNVKVSDESGDDPPIQIPPIVTAAQWGNFVRSFAVIEIVVLLPKLGKQWGWTESQISGLLFLLFAGQIVSFLTAPLVIRKVTWAWVIATKMLLSGLTIFVGFVSDKWLMAAILSAIGIIAGLITMLSLYLSVTTQGQSVKGSSRHEAGVGAGGVFGPVLGGVAIRYSAPLTAFLLPLSLAFLTFVLWDLRAIRDKGSLIRLHHD
ncbi:MAG: MFS transporter [Armatimonadetes bacterium]|nr:MFS transporter [Armatimonadota bacterium]MCX7969058.1 MFS transporter [Armatimonadota bacterium]MDW8143861.1 MFS transporter [Armatimonadota bacterium]